MLLHKLFQHFKAANVSFKIFRRDWYYLVLMPCKWSYFFILIDIGRPECNVLLAQCAIYLAKAPKSHLVYSAMTKAVDEIRNNPSIPAVPLILRNPTSKQDREDGHGVGYTSNLEHVEKLQYMPEGMESVKFLWEIYSEMF